MMAFAVLVFQAKVRLQSTHSGNRGALSCPNAAIFLREQSYSCKQNAVFSPKRSRSQAVQKLSFSLLTSV